ncbi:MAG TPA: fumarylacetoacetate hydrolase family protein [Candidatus Xenobia bacterium]|jgi:2-oxopent-4-enoate/cis-2-oxohex-4-enoate hydratase
MQLETLAQELWTAEVDGRPCDALTARHPELTLDDAYRIQGWLRQKRGTRLVGWKVGLTTAAVQKWLKLDHPDFGALHSDMEVEDGGTVLLSRLIAPRAEGELAFVLGRKLRGPGVGAAEALRAIDFILPAIEIIDSRIRDWKIGAVDTVADNGSSARFVIGRRPMPVDMDLKTIGLTLRVNGEVSSTGAGAACMGNPLNALLWLVNELGRQGLALEEGQVVLSGALSEVHTPKPGDHVEVQLGGGRVEVRFE